MGCRPEDGDLVRIDPTSISAMRGSSGPPSRSPPSSPSQPRLIALFSVAKAIVTGNQPKVGDAGRLERAELAGGDGDGPF